MKKFLTLLVAVTAAAALAVSCRETPLKMRISIFSDHFPTGEHLLRRSRR